MSNNANLPVKQNRNKPVGQKKKRVGLWVILAILVLAVAGIILTIFLTNRDAKQTDPKAMAANSGHFLREGAMPELSKEGIKCVITEAYYTQDGNLMLKFKLSNGLDKNQHLKTLDITLKNENDETIAIAATDSIDANYIIPAGGYSDMTFYVSPDYLQKSDDDLDKLTYEIRTTGDVIGAETDNSGTTESSAAAESTTTAP